MADDDVWNGEQKNFTAPRHVHGEALVIGDPICDEVRSA